MCPSLFVPSCARWQEPLITFLQIPGMSKGSFASGLTAGPMSPCHRPLVVSPPGFLHGERATELDGRHLGYRLMLPVRHDLAVRRRRRGADGSSNRHRTIEWPIAVHLNSRLRVWTGNDDAPSVRGGGIIFNCPGGLDGLQGTIGAGTPFGSHPVPDVGRWVGMEL
jgi:hypothetical protein